MGHGLSGVCLRYRVLFTVESASEAIVRPCSPDGGPNRYGRRGRQRVDRRKTMVAGIGACVRLNGRGRKVVPVVPVVPVVGRAARSSRDADGHGRVDALVWHVVRGAVAVVRLGNLQSWRLGIGSGRKSGADRGPSELQTRRKLPRDTQHAIPKGLTVRLAIIVPVACTPFCFACRSGWREALESGSCQPWLRRPHPWKTP